MLFNSFHFAVFLVAVFVLYWFVFKRLRSQNMLLLIASYFFYGCWDYRFLFLLAFSTFLDYYSGLKIYQTENKAQKKVWLILSVGINLAFLGFFKYFNFFIESFSDLLRLGGVDAGFSTLSIILPVGISFYTFHGLSYVFDIYNNKIKPTTNWVDYTLFVSFFPLLVAGPIERATHLLPQVESPRKFSYTQAVDGLRQMLWGFFKKVVIADNCAVYANLAFNETDSFYGLPLVAGAVFFAFQIYGDFSGYSDIALGTARLFGFELLRNFSFPYFSRSIAEFWRRWHISLSSWFRDYLYIPLGGSRGGTGMAIRNTFIIFIVSGFWHGANWTFVVWGALNALFIIPSVLFKTNRKHLDTVAVGRVFPLPGELGAMLLTFTLTCFAWIFFRAASIGHAMEYLVRLCNLKFNAEALQDMFLFVSSGPKLVIPALLLFIVIEWVGRDKEYAIRSLGIRWPMFVRLSFYNLLVFMLFFFSGKEQEFIYFQF
ncbi:MAG: MBOAT family O-acyltransferase [Chitinophagaceae bacterium]